MAAAPPATEESSVSYEELNDLNAEFDDAETELSMYTSFLILSCVVEGLPSSGPSRLTAAAGQYDQCDRHTALTETHTLT